MATTNASRSSGEQSVVVLSPPHADAVRRTLLQQAEGLLDPAPFVFHAIADLRELDLRLVEEAAHRRRLEHVRDQLAALDEAMQGEGSVDYMDSRDELLRLADYMMQSGADNAQSMDMAPRDRRDALIDAEAGAAIYDQLEEAQ
jgi:hypothetical protein